MWTGFGVGAITGSFLVGATTGWALALGAFTASRHPTAAVAAFALGGMLWVSFNPVSYTLVQDTVEAGEQQPVITLWNGVLQGIAPLSLAASGPLVSRLGASTTLWLSCLATLALALAATAVLTLGHLRSARRGLAVRQEGA